MRDLRIHRLEDGESLSITARVGPRYMKGHVLRAERLPLGPCVRGFYWGVVPLAERVRQRAQGDPPWPPPTVAEGAAPSFLEAVEALSAALVDLQDKPEVSRG